MKKNDFIHLNLYADQNCLFNSVAMIMIIEKECKKYLVNYKNKDCHIKSVCFSNKMNKLGDKLRKHTVTWLKQNLDTVIKLNKTIRELIEDHLDEDNNTINKYFKFMKTNYSSQLEIIGLANYLGRSIHIFDQDKFKITNIGFKINKENVNKDIYLRREVGLYNELLLWPLFHKKKAKTLMNTSTIKTKQQKRTKRKTY